MDAPRFIESSTACSSGIGDLVGTQSVGLVGYLAVSRQSDLDDGNQPLKGVTPAVCPRAVTVPGSSPDTVSRSEADVDVLSTNPCAEVDASLKS